jgi:hypothetical protein
VNKANDQRVGFCRESEVNCLGIRATILLRIDWLSCLIGALLW